MTTPQPLATVPESLNSLLNSADLMEEFKETMLDFKDYIRDHPEVLSIYANSPVETFLEHAPDNIQKLFSPDFRKMIDEIIRSDPDYLQKLADAQIQERDLFGDGWGKVFCEIGLWTAIVAAIGGAIAISQGSLLAPIIATSDGILLPVLAAITGLSEGTIGTLAAGGGFTLGKLIDAACGA